MKNSIKFACVFILMIALLGMSPVSAARALGTTFTVNSLADEFDGAIGNGICSAIGDLGCTLRAALEEAYISSTEINPVTINFSVAGTINLSLGLGMLVWNASYVTVDAENLIDVSGASLAAGQPILQISGSHNTLLGLTLRDGPYDGLQVGEYPASGSGSYNTIRYSYFLGNQEAGVHVHGSLLGGGQFNNILDNFIGHVNANQTACAAGEGNGGNGIQVDTAAHATMIASNFISCNGLNGILISGTVASPTGTVIHNNHIGLDWAAAMPNGQHGIYELQGKDTSIRSNFIAGNTMDGVNLFGSSGAVLNGNRIGTTENGLAARPNGGNGVVIEAASGNIVGGHLSSDERNLISGNPGCGVSLRNGAANNEVDFNLIGLDAYGMEAIPNGQAGVCILNADDNIVGTSMFGVSQYISGNLQEGVYIQASSGNFIGQTNRIGVAVDDATPLGNGMEGVLIDNASDNLVLASNVSNNGQAGVAVFGTGSTGNRITFMSGRDNGGLMIDLGNDGPTPNDSYTPPGPNDWLAYPVITAASGKPVSLEGMACAGCTVQLYRALGITTAPGGGGIFIDEVTANASGAWSYTLPPGISAAQTSLVAFQHTTGWSGNSSEMSPADGAYLFHLPLVMR
jgi:CSLREA domain-containing protein